MDERCARLECRTGRQVKTLPDLILVVFVCCGHEYIEISWNGFGFWLGLIKPSTLVVISLHDQYVRVRSMWVWPKFYLSWKAGIVFLVEDNVLGANGIHSVEGTNGTCKIGGSLGGFGKDFFDWLGGCGYCPGTPVPTENTSRLWQYGWNPVTKKLAKSSYGFAGYSGFFHKESLNGGYQLGLYMTLL